MYLSTFPRPRHDTGWGLHDSASTGSLPGNWQTHVDNLISMGVTWYKVLADGTNKVDWVRFLTKHGIMCIIRLYSNKPHPKYRPSSDVIGLYVHAGAQYFEYGNEPNIGSDEWSDWPGMKNIGEILVPQILACNGLIKSVGGVPLLPAMTPGGVINQRETWRQILVALKKRKALDSMRGAGVAIHVRPLNNPLDTPREDGNAISKDGVPIFVDQNGKFIRYANTTTHDEYTWYIDFFNENLGYCPPLFGTEAGYSIGDEQNSDYYPITRATHADWNHELAMRFSPKHSKRWKKELFCECYWLDRDGGTWKKDEIGHTDLEKKLLETPPLWDRTSIYLNNEPSSIKEGGTDEEETIREFAWNALGIALNPDAMFPKLARKHNLGNPVTGEFDMMNYRAQAFTGGIVYATIGEWDSVKIIDW